MAEFRNIEFFFNQGLNQRVDEKLTPSLLEAKNATITHDGSIKKRSGFAALTSANISGSTAGINQGALALATIENQSTQTLALVTTGSILGWSQNVGSWMTLGNHTACSVDSIGIEAGVKNKKSPSMDTLSNGASGQFDVYAWYVDEPSGSIHYSVIDSQTGDRIVDDVALTSKDPSVIIEPGVRVVTCDRRSYIFYFQASGSQQGLVYRYLNQSQPYAISTETLLTSSAAFYSLTSSLYGQRFDAVAFSTTQEANQEDAVAVLGWITPSNTLNLTTIDENGSTTTRYITGFAAATLYGLTTMGTRGVAATMYNLTPNGVRAIVTDASLNENLNYLYAGADAVASSSNASLRYAGGVMTNTSSVKWYLSYQAPIEGLGSGSYNGDENHGFNQIKTFTITSGTNAATSVTSSIETYKLRAGLSSNPFRPWRTTGDTTRHLLGVSFDGPLQMTNFLCDQSGSVVARLSISGEGADQTYLPRWTRRLHDDSKFTCPLVYSTRITDVEGSKITVANNVQALTVDLLPSRSMVDASHSLTVLGGGSLRALDTSHPFDLGHHLFPDIRDLNPSASSTWQNFTVSPNPGLIASGSYFYRLTYDRVDAQGNQHTSAASPRARVDVTGSSGTNAITIRLPTLTFGDDLGSVLITPYRTTVNQSETSLFYRVTSASNPAINDPRQSYITITDTNADSSIIDNDILFTAGGVTNNTAPPGSDIIHTHRNRLWVNEKVRGNDILWFSKEQQLGLGPEFSLEQRIRVPSDGGRVTSLATLGDILIIFKDDAIYALGGRGPDNTQAGESFSDPQVLRSDVGCINRNSIIETPIGVFFLSRSGIKLLGAGGDVRDVGDEVQDAFNGRSINSVAHVETDRQVRFYLDDGSALVYCYDFNRWVTHVSHTTAIDAITWNGSTVLLAQSASQVMVSDDDVFTDAGQAYEFAIRTPFFNPGVTKQQAGICQRTDIYGTRLSACDFNVTASFLGETHTESWSSDTATMEISGALESHHILRHNVCQGISLRFSDGYATGSAFSLECAQFKMRPMVNTFRNNRSRRI